MGCTWYAPGLPAHLALGQELWDWGAQHCKCGHTSTCTHIDTQSHRYIGTQTEAHPTRLSGCTSRTMGAVDSLCTMGETIQICGWKWGWEMAIFANKPSLGLFFSPGQRNPALVQLASGRGKPQRTWEQGQLRACCQDPELGLAVHSERVKILPTSLSPLPHVLRKGEEGKGRVGSTECTK